MIWNGGSGLILHKPKKGLLVHSATVATVRKLKILLKLRKVLMAQANWIWNKLMKSINFQLIFSDRASNKQLNSLRLIMKILYSR